jgi:hypothetical protein
MKITRQLSASRKTSIQEYDHIIAIGLKVVERYIIGISISDSILEGFLRDILTVSVECLSRPATRELIY